MSTSHSLCGRRDFSSVKAGVKRAQPHCQFHPVQLVILLGLSMISSGCSKNDLPDYNRLGGLRILAIVADQPEVAPGATVTLTPVVSDLGGAGRPLTFSAQGCTDPGVGYGADPTCDGSPTTVALGTGTFSPAAPAFTDAAPTISVVVPPTVLLAHSPPDQYNGVPYLVTYQLSAADGSTLRSFKRVLASAPGKPALNQNPGALRILANGSPLTGLPSPSALFQISVAGVGAESYSAAQADGSFTPMTETLDTTWFLSDGDFERFRTVADGSLTYTTGAAPVGHSTVIAVVTRDGRGGMAYRVYSF